MYPKVHIVPLREDNYCYLVEVRGAPGVVIIDPGVAAPVQASLESLNLRPLEIWLTHKHTDHIGGASELARRYDIPVRGSEEIPNLAVRFLKAPGPGRFLFGAVDVRVVEIPGHTLHHVVYEMDGAVFTGDVLFLGGVGRVFEGTAEAFHEALQKYVATLPDHTRLYCGHEYAERNLRFAMQLEPGNQSVLMQYVQYRARQAEKQPSVPGEIGVERRTNPFLRVNDPLLREALKRRLGSLPPDSAAIFAQLRSLRDQFQG